MILKTNQYYISVKIDKLSYNFLNIIFDNARNTDSIGICCYNYELN